LAWYIRALNVKKSIIRTTSNSEKTPTTVDQQTTTPKRKK